MCILYVTEVDDHGGRGYSAEFPQGGVDGFNHVQVDTRGREMGGGRKYDTTVLVPPSPQ